MTESHRHTDDGSSLVADLHMHSTASDGKLSPAEVIAAAAAGGAGFVSLTDHDTVAGLAEARAAAGSAGVEFVTGVEISTLEGEEIHLLGYGFREDDPGLLDFLADQQEARRKRGVRFVEVLIESGALPPEASLDVDASTSLTRPHIADLLMRHGAVETRSEAFDRYLTPETPTFVPKPLPSGADVVDIVHRAGGIVSLAHPGHGVPHRSVLSLIAAGLDAIEVHHPSHDDMLEDYYRTLARREGLLMTGGSDFHAPDGREGRNVVRTGFHPDEKVLHRLRTLPDG